LHFELKLSMGCTASVSVGPGMSSSSSQQSLSINSSNVDPSSVCKRYRVEIIAFTKRS
jgi:hypothetical protein